MHFDPEIVRVFAAIGASLDLDLYNLERLKPAADSKPA